MRLNNLHLSFKGYKVDRKQEAEWERLLDLQGNKRNCQVTNVDVSKVHRDNC